MHHWKLRRLAPRAKRIVTRHQDLEPALAAYAGTLIPAAETFMDGYDRLQTLTTTRGVEYREGKEAIIALHDKMAAWLPQLAASGQLENFSPGNFGATPAVPDDVIADAELLVDIVTAHETTKPGSIHFAQPMIDEIAGLIALATAEWAEAEGAKSEHQTLVVQNRRNAKALDIQLIAFRKSLGRILGRSHPDFQALRVSKIDRSVLEEGEEADLPEALIPAQEEPPALEDAG